MIPSPHLYAAISGHGYGHLAQVAPVLEELRRRLPGLVLTVQCPLPGSILRRRIPGPFEHVAEAADIGMVMDGPLTVLGPESLAAHEALHAAWPERLDRQATLIGERRPDLLLAGVPYVAIAAASLVSCPALALGSLNWADILAAYCPNTPALEDIRRTMLAAYAQAEPFLQPAPSMPMAELRNGRRIGPIASLGRHRRAEIAERIGLAAGDTLVLVSLGGVATRLPMERWPETPGLAWLVPASWGIERPDTTAFESLAGIPFLDLLCSSDVFLVKPGYGSFVEAACAGVRVLYVERGDWPEEPWLAQWLARHGNGALIERQALEAGAVMAPIADLLAQPARPPVVPAGAGEAADIIEGRLPG